MIFADARDCAQFVEWLARSLQRCGVELHAYVLLPNHFHLLARTLRRNLGRWMHWLLVSYTVAFNRRHRKVGHLFQGRYKSLLVETGRYLLECSRYLHLNPVRGEVLGRGDPKERRARLRDYRWSTYRGYAALGKQARFVTEELVLGELEADRRRDGRMRYRRFVEEGLVREVENPAQAAQWQTVLGSETFLQAMSDRMQIQREKRREVTALRRATRGPAPGAIVERIAKGYGSTPERLLSGRAYGLEARSIAMWVIWQLCGMSLREIGGLFGGTDYAAVAQRIRRLEQNPQRRRELQEVLRQCQNV